MVMADAGLVAYYWGKRFVVHGCADPVCGILYLAQLSRMVLHG